MLQCVVLTFNAIICIAIDQQSVVLKVLLLIDSLIDFLVTFVSKNKTKQEKTDFLSKMYLLSAFAL